MFYFTKAAGKEAKKNQANCHIGNQGKVALRGCSKRRKMARRVALGRAVAEEFVAVVAEEGAGDGNVVIALFEDVAAGD